MDALADMSVLEIVAAAVLALGGIAIQLWMKLGKSKLSLEDQQRLEAVAAQAVAAAEEMATNKNWTGEQKLAFARETIQKGFPDLDMEYVDLAIHASLALVSLGNAGASSTDKKPSAEATTA
jgi:hypothetical protein